MMIDDVRVKPETRNHKGFFLLDEPYKLVDIKPTGWAFICLNESSCHYVDPDNLYFPQD